jgi:1-acyl-sn-glycerol-3-phosphate acyltransferase
MWVYRSVRTLIRILLFPYLRVKHQGRDHLNIEGPVLLAPTHRSNLDSMVLAGVGERRMRALAKESLFTNPLFGWLVAALGAFPVRRGEADREALRAATDILRGGEQLIVFPEGTRQTGARVTGVFDGTAFLASRSGAAVVPVGIAGTEQSMPSGVKFPRRSRVAVVAGEPIRPPEGRMSRRQLSEFSRIVSERLQEVFDEAHALASR